MKLTLLRHLQTYLSCIVFFTLLISTINGHAEQAVSSKVAEYLEQIATINLMEQDQQEAPHKALLSEIESYWEDHQEDASAWVVVALSRASYARSRGMSALGIMKDVRRELEQAIEMNAQVMNGFAQAFLGRVYFNLPAWPLSYGSDKKAKKYLEEALAINSHSMENQYYYGTFMNHNKDYEKAIEHLTAAKSAAPLTGGEYWTANLRKQIDGALDYAHSKVK